MRIFRALPCLVLSLLWLSGAAALPAVLTVTNLADSGPGTLRNAISAAQAGDTNEIIVRGTIRLTSGQLTINKNLRISGPGAALLTVSGNTNSRVFNISAGTVTIAGITVADGWGDSGGGIHNSATLSLENCVIRNNTDTNLLGFGGGGIRNATGGRLTLDKTSVRDNLSAAQGGGIENDGELRLLNSTISGNMALAYGGGILNQGEMAAVNCTVSDNSVPMGSETGGGIDNQSPFAFPGNAIMTLTNCTITANSAGTNVMVAGGVSSGKFGDGDAIVRFKNTIIAGNVGRDGFVPTVGGTLSSLGHNLDGDGTCNLSQPTDRPRTNPLLGPLRNNGGPTFTHALLTNSPAINAGDTASAPPTDQRGSPRIATADIGAYEFGPVIEPTNSPPNAVTDLINTLEDQAVTFNVLANDTDPDDDALVLLSFTNPTNGVARTNGTTGTFIYTAATNFFGTDAFSYVASDGRGGTAQGAVALTVTAVNDPPRFSLSATNLAVLGDGQPVSRPNWATNLSAGPLNEAAQTLSFLVTNSAPALFIAQPALSPNGTLTFTPNLGATGLVMVSVRLQDSGGTTNGGINLSGPQTFFITLSPINLPPSLSTITNQSTPEDTVLDVPFMVSDPDTPLSNLSLSASSTNTALVALTNLAFGGSGANRTLRIIPATNQFGSTLLTVTVSDGLASASSSFSLTVSPVNDRPSFTLSATNLSVPGDGQPVSRTNWATQISAGPPDEAAQSLSFLLSNSAPALFIAQPALSPSGTLSFTPTVGATGTVTVSVRLQDNGGTANGGLDQSLAQNFFITLTSFNRSPTAVNDLVNTLEDQAVTFNVLTNDTDPDADALRLLSFTNPTNGVVRTNSTTGTFIYTPATNFFGTDAFSYIVSDGRGGTAQGAVALTVIAVNDPPRFALRATNYTVLEDAGSTNVLNWATNIAAGPLNEAGQGLSFVLVSNSNPGLFAVAPAISTNGTLSFATATNANGNATLTMVLRDSSGTQNGGSDTSAPQLFTLTLTALNDRPSFTLSATNLSVPGDGQPVSRPNWATQISAGPPDEAAQSLSFLLSNSAPALFIAQPALSPNGTLTFTPNLGATGLVVVSVRLQDSGGTTNGGINLSGPQTFFITLSRFNLPPSLSTITNQSTFEDTPLDVAFTVSDPDTPLPNLSLSASSTNTALLTNLLFGGSGANRTLRIIPATNQFGSTLLTVTVSDGLASASSSFSLTVSPVNDRPSFSLSATNLSVPGDGEPVSRTNWATQISAGPPDEAAQSLSFLLSNSAPALFIAQPALSPSGTLSFTPTVGATGTVTVSARLQDSGGTANGGLDQSLAQNFFITQTSFNRSPTAVNDLVNTLEDQAATFNVLTNDTDPDADALRLLSFTNPTNGVVRTNSTTGTFSYTPATNFFGTDAFSYMVSDGRGGTAQGAVALTVIAVNDPPRFSLSATNLAVPGDGQPVSRPNWATNLSAGPPNEAAQTLSFLVTNSAPMLFTNRQPALSPNGTLTFTPNLGATGLVMVSVRLQDSGGTTNGGINLSGPQTFFITLNPFSLPPSLSTITNQSTPEDTVLDVPFMVSDPDTPLSNLSLSASSTNTTLLTNLLFGGSGANRTLRIIPATNQFGSTLLTVTVSDGLASASSSFSLTVSPVNDRPSFTLSATNLSVPGDGQPVSRPNWATQISAGPPDEAAQSLSFLLSNSAPALFIAQPTLSPSGTLSFTPTVGATGTVTVSARLQDNGGTANGGLDQSLAQNFFITLTSFNRSPTAVNDLVNTLEDQAATFNVLTNDTDPDADALRLLSFTNPTNGVVRTNSTTGTFIYTPATNFFGTDAFSYVVSDGRGGTAQGAVALTVIAVNDPPRFSLSATSLAVLEDAPAQMLPNWATNIAAGPANEVGKVLTFTLSNSNPGLFISGPALDANGLLSFTPAPNSNGTATLTVLLRDNGGTQNGGSDTSAPQLFTLTLTALNDRPSFTLSATNLSVPGDGQPVSRPNWATQISAGPPDEAAQSLSFLLSNSAPALFIAQPALSPSGTLSFTPTVGATGTVTVSARLQDNGGTANGGLDQSLAQNFFITLTSFNRSPTAVNDLVNTLEDQAATFNVLTNDTDPDADALRLLSFTNPTNGVVRTNSTTGTFIYTPATNFFGTDAFSYMVSDGRGGTAQGAVALTVIAVNDPPRFSLSATSLAVLEDAPAQMLPNWATNIAAGPANEVGKVLTFTLSNSNPGLFISGPALDANGLLSFTPAPNSNGTATLTVLLRDNGGTQNGGSDTSAPQLFTLTLTALNDRPSFTLSATNLSVPGDGQPVSRPNWATQISAGPPDEAAQSLSFLLSNSAPALFIAQPALSPSGTLSFTPTVGATGTVTVSARLQDNGGTANGGLDQSLAQNFFITLTSFNRSPTAVNDLVNTLEDQAVTFNVLTNDTDPDADALRLLSFTNPTNGVVRTNSTTGTFIYTPATNFFGTDAFSYVVSDGRGGTAQGAVALTVSPVNDRPSFTLSATNLSVPGDGQPVSRTNWATQISAGPPDEAAQSLSFLLSNSAPALFIAQPALSPSGTLSFTPTVGATGTVTVSARLQDNGGTANGGLDQSLAQNFFITLTSFNRSPTAVNDLVNTLEDQAATFNVLTNDTDPDADALRLLSFTNPTNGVVRTNSTTGLLTYTPATNFFGTDAFSYVVSDGRGGTAQGAVALTVIAVNDPPRFSLSATSLAVLEDAPAQMLPNWATNIAAGPANEVGKVLTFTLSNSNPGLFISGPALDANGLLSFTPAPNSNGTATLTVLLRDNGGTQNGGSDTSAPQLFTLTLTALNDRPSFTLSATNLSVPGDGQPVSRPNWATQISAGPPDEAAQSLSFLLSNSAPALFIAQPALSPSGTLSFTPTVGATGTVTVSARLQDNGGTANGGLDQSLAQNFFITLTSFNRSPTAVNDLVNTLEDQAATFNVLTNDTDPDADALRLLSFTNPTNGVVRTNSTTGTFIYTPATNFFGTDAFSYMVSDGRGGTAQGAVALTVIAVNDPPAFVPGPDQMVAATAGPQAVTNWAKLIRAGPHNEESQSLSFALLSDKPFLFEVQPAISLAGDLSYTPRPTTGGTARVTVMLRDNGGAANGGQDTFVARFSITVIPQGNLPPVASAGPDRTAAEGSLILFDASASTDPEGQPLSFSWDFGDGSTGLGVRPTHRYADDGRYIVTLIAQDSQQALGTDTLVMTVSNVAPTVEAGPDMAELVGDLVVFNGSFSDPGSADTHTIEWDFGDGTALSGVLVATNIYRERGSYTVTLLVIDDEGGTGEDKLTVTVQSAFGLAERAMMTLLPHTQASPKIREAVKKIHESLQRVWIDEMHVQEKDGKKAFDKMRDAAHLLQDLLKEQQKKPKLSPEIIMAVRSAADDLIQSTRLLAETLFIEVNGTRALDPKRQEKVEKELDKAWEELGKGDQERDRGDFEKAIESYKKSWEHTVKAENEATHKP